MSINLEELQNSLAEIEKQNEEVLKEIAVKETEYLIKCKVLKGRMRAQEVLENLVIEGDYELAQAELEQKVLEHQAEKIEYEADSINDEQVDLAQKVEDFEDQIGDLKSLLEDRKRRYKQIQARANFDVKQEESEKAEHKAKQLEFYEAEVQAKQKEKEILERKLKETVENRQKLEQKITILEKVKNMKSEP